MLDHEKRILKLWEFSKRMVRWMCIFWYIGGVFGLTVGTYAVITEITTVDTVYNFLMFYIGVPVSGTILGYLCKAAFENVAKINKKDEVKEDKTDVE